MLKYWTFILFMTFSFLSFGQKVNSNVIENKALRVLELKCNVCHVSDYPRNIFSIENINDFSKKIYKQVFIKEKMPKGDSIKLSDEEKGILLDWIKTQIQLDESD